MEDIVDTTNAKKKVSFLSIALGSLVVTGLSTGSAEASWGAPRCKTQCSKIVVGKDEKKVNDCATNCKNIDIMDVLRPNAAKLNETNKKHFQTALKYQQSIKEKEHTKIEGQLKAETAKKKPSQSKIKDLNKKQDKLIAEINSLGSEIESMGKTSKTPERPTTLPGEKKAPERPKSGPHISKPPSDMPPPYTPPPSDMPPKLPEEATHEHPTSHESHDKPMHQAQKTGHIPTPPKMGETPREILKADIQAQNPGKKPHEINALVKQHLETEHPGKSPAEINQALKEHYEGKHPGKTHAEILEAVKAGGGQGPSGSPTGTSSGTTDSPSSQEGKRKSTTGSKPGGGSLTDALSGLGDNPMARLKKVDPQAEEKRKAEAEAKLKSSGKGGSSGDVMSDLQSALAKRRGAIAGHHDTSEDQPSSNPHQDFEQDWTDND